MNVEETIIPGLKIIYLNEFEDLRGRFIKVFNADFFKKNGLATDFKECYYSISSKNVIRGMHFQEPPYESAKLVYINHGKIIDVVLDIRTTSPTYRQYFSIELNESRPVLVNIPVGCAHGFLSLTKNSVVSYLQTSVYNKDFDKGIRYNSFEMDWGVKNPIISNRDLNLSKLSEYNSVF